MSQYLKEVKHEHESDGKEEVSVDVGGKKVTVKIEPQGQDESKQSKRQLLCE